MESKLSHKFITRANVNSEKEDKETTESTENTRRTPMELNL